MAELDVRGALGLSADATDDEVAEALRGMREELRVARGAPEGWERVAEDESVVVFDSYTGGRPLSAPSVFGAGAFGYVIAYSEVVEDDGRVRTSVRVRKEKESVSGSEPE